MEGNPSSVLMLFSSIDSFSVLVDIKELSEE